VTAAEAAGRRRAHSTTTEGAPHSAATATATAVSATAHRGMATTATTAAAPTSTAHSMLGKRGGSHGQ
jgi:hypothetical protein